MVFRRLLSVLAVVAFLILLVPLGGLANAQTIETPAGERHLDMTEDEATQLLKLARVGSIPNPAKIG